MKSLLYPAVALMNRLSFGMKFSLISVLFLLPMLATNYVLVRDSWSEFQGTRIELQSLDLLGSSLALRRDLIRIGGEIALTAPFQSPPLPLMSAPMPTARSRAKLSGTVTSTSSAERSTTVSSFASLATVARGAMNSWPTCPLTGVASAL